MAIVSVGFDGTVTEAQWAALMPSVGGAEIIVGSNDLAVTAVSGVDRTVSVSAGSAVAHGVMATLSPAQSIQHAIAATGTRWDAVCLRRDWTTNATTLVTVQGTSVEAWPAGLLNTPGTSHDQVLALVQITAGQQLPTSVLRQRAWAGKHYEVESLLTLSRAPLGALGTLADVPYRRQKVAGVVTTHRTEAHGSALFTFPGGQSVWVSGLINHGLGAIPSIIIATPVVDGSAGVHAAVQAGSVTTTQFRITIRRTDAVFSAGTLVCYWLAKR